MLEKQLEGAVYERIVFGGGFRIPRTLTLPTPRIGSQLLTRKRITQRSRVIART